jgi:hypothetical protein
MYRTSVRLSCCMLASLALFLALFANAGKAHASVVFCQLTVPADALSSQGLAMPWKLGGGCHENSASQAVFVQGVIFDPATKQFSTYSPLVIDAGTTPAVVPTPPTLPTNAVVALFGGGDDDVTQLTGAAGQCVNGADGKLFGQVFFCNAQHFFQVVNAAGVTIPSLGTEADGLPCPTVRDFRIVDQDQSDNVQTTYLVTSTGQTAQNTAANRTKLGLTTANNAIKNPSDNRLLTQFVDPAIGCKPWTVPVLGDPGAVSATQATDELQAAAAQGSLVALIPDGDPMVGPNDLAMVNAYRINVNQPSVDSLVNAGTQPYCSKMQDFAPTWIANHKAAFQGPSPEAGTTLFDFITSRFSASLVLLGCK